MPVRALLASLPRSLPAIGTMGANTVQPRPGGGFTARPDNCQSPGSVETLRRRRAPPGFTCLPKLIAAALVGAEVLGMRVRRREPPRPRPEEQPHLPDGGPVREEREAREPDDVPQHKKDRLTPYQLNGFSRGTSRPSGAKERPRWSEVSSGVLGSGVLGSGGLGRR